MTDPAFSNLLAWSIQVALVVLVGSALPAVFRLHDPGSRHVYWRAVLLGCLLLPVVQPWREQSVVDASEVTAPTLPPETTSASTQPIGRTAVAPVGGRQSDWSGAIGVILVGGVIARLTWLAAGLLRLRRLRRMGEPVAPSDEDRDLESLLGAGAEVRYIPTLGQPVTFGIRRPIVLLPDSLRALPAAVRRAVLAHELWHVRRRDWAWVLIEEGIRSALWFHPGIWWLISRVQTSREEVVDELTIRVTQARRPYLEALLAFADRPTHYPVAPLARRRHLFERMLIISREVVMSSNRIVASCGAMAIVVLLAGIYGVVAFPLRAVAPSEVPQQTPPRDPRRATTPVTSHESELERAIAGRPSAPAPYIELSKLQEQRGDVAAAEATLTRMRAAMPANTAALHAAAAFYQRQGNFERALAAFEEIAAVEPSDPMRHHTIGTVHWEKAFRDTTLSEPEKRSHIQLGIAAEDRALTLKPDFVEALIYKNILLRLQANLETDVSTKRALLSEADRLRSEAMALQKERPRMEFVPADGSRMPPPPPPPPPPGAGVQYGGEMYSPASSSPPFTGLIDGMRPVRIGGNIQAPTKIVNVVPILPPIARQANVSGVVIIEAVIDVQGRIAAARVLRSIPLLDQAALDAVRQWEFEPTLLNGQPVPVIMTITVNFTGQEHRDLLR